MLSFRERYRKEVVPVLKKQFGWGNDLAVPRVEKAVVHMGVGKIFRDEKTLEEAKAILKAVTAQEPASRKARKAIASFKTRVGNPIGLVVTLRGKRLADFCDRFIHTALPRVRDFRGIPATSFDERGSLTVGVKEHIIFPETTELPTKQIHGMAVTITTTAKRKEEGVALLKALGFPIRK